MEKTKRPAQSQQAVLVVCPECDSQNLICDYDTGEHICGNCGLVMKEVMMDEGPDWRSFSLEERESRSRVGTPTSYTFQDKGLSTSIDRIDRDALGHRLPFSSRPRIWRLRKWQLRSRVHSSTDRNLAQAMMELDRLSARVYIPEPVKERAALIYRRALDEDLIRGRSITAIVAASVYASCRSTGTPRSLQEIAEASLVRRKDVARCYRLLLRQLSIPMPVADPLIYVTQIAEKAGLSGMIQAAAAKILNEAKKRYVSTGKDPKGLAAAALYIACKQAGDKKTQKDIARLASVTEVTVRNRFRTLEKQLNLTVTLTDSL